jgi:hypothetical protein
MRKTGIVAMAALLLGACASTGTHQGMVYRDGSWYAPASEGRGDYYTGNEPRHDMAYDWPWAWSVGFVPFGGYCPVQYRYCTSFWADSWYGGPGYYLPYAYAWRSGSGHRHRQQPQDEETPLAQQPGNRQRSREPREPRSMRPRDGGLSGASRREDGGAPRARRRAASTGTNPQ